MFRFIAIIQIFAFALAMEFASPLLAATSRAEIQKRTADGAIKYFEENSHPETGLTLDRAENFPKNAPLLDPGQARLASIAATGFSLAVQAHAADKGLLKKDVVYARTLKTLKFCRDHVARWKGWFAHFVNWKTGERMWNSEFSSIDTALLLAGALYAAEVFPNTEVATLATELYTAADFEALRTDNGKFPKKLTLSMGYFPESGFIPTQWDMFAEQMILIVLGLGHPTKPLPAASWLVFSREYRNGIMGYDQALFVHQYSQVFLDFRKFEDAFPSYFENSSKISLVHRGIAKGNKTSLTFREGFWGFSAGLAPDERYEVATAAQYGTTVCIGCAQASAMFVPDVVFEDLIRWTDGPVGLQLWGRYGLTDSLDLDKNWVSPSVFGITVGAAYLSFANLDSKSSIWSRFLKHPAIRSGMDRASLAGHAARLL